MPEHTGPNEARAVFVHRWRLVHALAGDQIRILAIIHGARLIENADPIEP